MTHNGWAPPALNHVEMVYGPGERQLALSVLAALGCRTIDSGSLWGRGLIDPERELDDSNNLLYVSEVTPEQLALEHALGEAAAEGTALEASLAAFARRMGGEPQRSSHFGIRCPDRTSFDARIRSVEEAAQTPELKGRLELRTVLFPGDPGAVSPKLAQAFVWTDVVAAGVLFFGQHFELQLAVAP
jgi:hypothetical protein